MKPTIATIEKVAVSMYIATQRAMGFKKIERFADLNTAGRAMYRVEAEAAIRALTPMITRAEKRAWSKGWKDCIGTLES